jgi:hypothetical protein
MVLPPRVKYFPNDAARQAAANQALQQHDAAIQSAPMTTGQPTISGGGQDEQGNPLPPSMAPGSLELGTPQSPVMPSMFKPSFGSVAGPGPNGLPQQINPAETKLGKLAHVLTSAASGVMASYGQMTPAGGAQAAREVPFQRAEQAAQLKQQQAQTALTQSQSQMVMTPYGAMPPGIAKIIFGNTINAGAKLGAAQIGATAKENVAGVNNRFKIVPNVGMFDTQSPDGQLEMVPQTQQGIVITPEIAKDHNLPDEFVGKPMSLQNLSAIQSSGPKVSSETSSSTTDLMGNSVTKNQRVSAPVVGGTATPAPANSAVSTLLPAKPVAQPTPAVPHSSGAPASNNPAAQLPPDVEQRITSSKLTPQEQQYVRGLLSYQGQMPSPRARNYAATLATLTALDPNFNAGNYDAIRKTLMDYTPGGTVGRQVLAFNTAMRHMGNLYDAAQALNNGNIQGANKFAKALGIQFGDDAASNFNIIHTYLGGELAKGFGGGVATDQSRGEAAPILALASSPKQFAGGFKAAVDLLRGKVGAQEDAYQKTVGRPISLLDQPAHQVLQKFGMETGPVTHVFSKSVWQTANPQGDVNAAVKAAAAQKYTIAP